MHHTMARLWGAGSLLLNPEHLIDLLLDRLEELSAAMQPAQVDMVRCSQAQREIRFD